MNHALNLATTTVALKAAHGDLAAAHTALTLAKRDLADAENYHILSGLEGKNEAARKAGLDALTTSEREAVEDAERDLRTTQLNLTLAELDYKLARELAALHRAELTTGGDS